MFVSINNIFFLCFYILDKNLNAVYTFWYFAPEYLILLLSHGIKQLGTVLPVDLFLYDIIKFPIIEVI